MVKKCKDCGRWLGKGKHTCPDDRFGKKSANWQGGTTINSDGYILEYCRQHPFSTKRGYVLQHRLIMEKYIKRFLLPNEVVHHINEIRDDNSIENLQLLSGLGEHNTIHKTKKESSHS